MTKYVYMTDYIKSSIKKLEGWLSKRGYGLFMSKLPTIEDEVDLERKVVFITTRSSKQNQLYSLLHECGHIVIRSRRDYNTRYSSSIAYTEGNTKKPSYRALVEEIEEEILAWREGHNLAKKLEIFVEEKSYYQYSSRWVMSYVVKAGVGKEHLIAYISSDKDKKGQKGEQVESNIAEETATKADQPDNEDQTLDKDLIS